MNKRYQGNWRLRLLVHVFQFAFKGWEYTADLEPTEDGKSVKSFTMKAEWPKDKSK